MARHATRWRSAGAAAIFLPFAPVGNDGKAAHGALGWRADGRCSAACRRRGSCLLTAAPYSQAVRGEVQGTGSGEEPGGVYDERGTRGAQAGNGKRQVYWFVSEPGRHE